MMGCSGDNDEVTMPYQNVNEIDQFVKAEIKGRLIDAQVNITNEHSMDVDAPSITTGVTEATAFSISATDDNQSTITFGQIPTEVAAGTTITNESLNFVYKGTGVFTKGTGEIKIDEVGKIKISILAQNREVRYYRGSFKYNLDATLFGEGPLEVEGTFYVLDQLKLLAD